MDEGGISADLKQRGKNQTECLELIPQNFKTNSFWLA